MSAWAEYKRICLAAEVKCYGAQAAERAEREKIEIPH
jgi:hypothetical protein